MGKDTMKELQPLLDTFSEEVHELVEMCYQLEANSTMAISQGQKIFGVVQSISKIQKETASPAYVEMIQIEKKLTELLKQFKPMIDADDDSEDQSKNQHPVASALIAYAAAVKFYIYAEDSTSDMMVKSPSVESLREGSGGVHEGDAINYIQDLQSFMKERGEVEENQRVSLARISMISARPSTSIYDANLKKSARSSSISSISSLPAPAEGDGAFVPNKNILARQYRLYRANSNEEEDTVALVKSILSMDQSQLQEISEEELESKRNVRTLDDKRASGEHEPILEDINESNDNNIKPGDAAKKKASKFLDVEFVVHDEEEDDNDDGAPGELTRAASSASIVPTPPHSSSGATGEEIFVFYTLFYSDPHDSPLQWVLDSKGYKDAMKSKRRTTSQSRINPALRGTLNRRSADNVYGSLHAAKRNNSLSSTGSLEHDVSEELSDASTEPLTPTATPSGSFGAATGAALQLVTASLLGAGKGTLSRTSKNRQTMIIIEGEQLMLVMGTNPEDERFRVKAGTIELLIERLANEEIQDLEYVRAFLLTFRAFTTPIDLINRLSFRFNAQNSRYKVTEGAESIPTSLRRNSDDGNLPNKSPGWFVQYRIINFVKKWADTCWFDFEGNELTYAALQQFIRNVRASPMVDLADSLDDFVMMKRKESLKNHDIDPYISGANSSGNGTPPPSKSTMPRRIAKMKAKKAGENRMRLSMFAASLSSDFLNLEVNSVARQLTMIDFEFFRRLDRSEIIRLFLSSACPPDTFYLLPPTTRLSAYAARFNRVSFWVATEIVTMPNLRQRVQVLQRFVQLAKLLSEFNNFNGVMAILAGLQNAAVYRLKKTWAALPQQHHVTLANLKRIMSFDGNYYNYRLLFNRDFPQFIPFMGLFLKDITFVTDGNPTFVESDNEHSPPLVNFSKFWKVFSTVENLLRYQKGIYYLPYHAEAYRFCSDLPSLDEDTLYEYSLLCEPRIEK